jgi:hypothetical protein
MNRPIHATAAEQRLVRGVDDGVDIQLRYVALNHPDPSSDATSHVSLLQSPNVSGPVPLTAGQDYPLQARRTGSGRHKTQLDHP